MTSWISLYFVYSEIDEQRSNFFHEIIENVDNCVGQNLTERERHKLSRSSLIVSHRTSCILNSSTTTTTVLDLKGHSSKLVL